MNVVTRAQPRNDRLFIGEHINDPYKRLLKLPESTRCPRCRAIFHHGHWQWSGSQTKSAHESTCQACHRIEDDYPAGIVTLSGDFVREHKEELINIARSQERRENPYHPQHRIMDIEQTGRAVVIRTTDIHLPRRIGEAIVRSCKGRLALHYEGGYYSIRVDWQRD